MIGSTLPVEVMTSEQELGRGTKARSSPSLMNDPPISKEVRAPLRAASGEKESGTIVDGDGEGVTLGERDDDEEAVGVWDPEWLRLRLAVCVTD